MTGEDALAASGPWLRKQIRIRFQRRENMQTSLFIFVGSLLAALAVGLGALGAHALKPHLTPQQLETFHTAVQYQMIHAIGLVLAGLLILHGPSRLFEFAGWTFLAGMLLFSGCLYAWLATGIRFLVHLVPLGGVAFIAAWLLLAIGAVGLGKKG
jgi:uncharacterized membrane protein YgdD (TMEM256/DUF423 family)